MDGTGNILIEVLEAEVYNPAQENFKIFFADDMTTIKAKKSDGTIIPFDSISGSGDLLASNNLSDVDNTTTAFNNIKQSATTISTGVGEIATQTEVNTGTDAIRWVTPQTLNNWTGGAGDMTKAIYDPDNVNSNAFDYENFKGLLIVLDDILTPPTITGTEDDYNPTGFETANLLRIDLTSNEDVTGFEKPPAGVNRIVFFQNISNFKWKIKNNDPGSIPENRVLNKDYNDKELKKGETGAYWYDHISNRWRPYTRIG